MARGIQEAVCKEVEVKTADIAADAVTNAKVVDDAISKEHLDSGIKPSHIVVYAGEFTWSGSGASKAETVTGAAASDIVLASIQSIPAQAASILKVVVTTNTVTVTLSTANTGNDAVIAYQVLRATT